MHETWSGVEASVAAKTFAIPFLLIAVVPVLTYTSVLGGPFDDADAEWYDVVGNVILLSVVFTSALAPAVGAIFATVHSVQRWWWEMNALTQVRCRNIETNMFGAI